jgi:hypothetical protein
MDAVSHQRPPPQTSVSHGQALPSIASLTSSLSTAEQSPIRPNQHPEARDSGNWSISQSKRECSCRLYSHDEARGCSVLLRHFADVHLQIHPPSPTTPWDCNCRPSSMPRTHRPVTRFLTRRLQLGILWACTRYVPYPFAASQLTLL